MVGPLISFTCPSFDDARALERLLGCCLELSRCNEFVVLDHRSRDETRALVEALQPRFSEHGIHLRYEYEARDFSRTFNFGDLWTRAIETCANEIVCWLDADFLLGPAFDAVVTKAVSILEAAPPRPFGVAFEVPLLGDGVIIDGRGILVSHGRWRVHSPRPRFVRRDDFQFRLRDNRFEKAIARRPAQTLEAPVIPLPSSSLVSIDVKPAERRRLRETMCVFQKWSIETGSDLRWLEAYGAGVLDGIDYPRKKKVWFTASRYVGQRFYWRNLDSAALLST